MTPKPKTKIVKVVKFKFTLSGDGIKVKKVLTTEEAHNILKVLAEIHLKTK